jgi:signal transduction histidine kinase/ActR/RegA family two-component response regulator
MAGISNRPDGYTQEIVDDLSFLMSFLGFLIKSYQKDRERKFIESKLQIQSKQLSEANNLLGAVYESSLDLQFVLNINGVVIDYHSLNKNNLYLASENFIGKKLQEVFQTKVGEQFQDAFEQAISSNSLVSFECTLSMEKGGGIYEARVVSLEDNKIVAFLRDITERVQMEEDIANARKLDSIGLLAGGIAHDFNNILSGLFGNIELARMKLPEEHAAYSHIKIAIQAFDRASQLTQQLLTFAKGGTPLIETVNIKEIIRESLEFNLSGSNVKGVVNIQDNLWQGKVDKGQIAQVVANLTINGIQAMPNGGTLTIDGENVKGINDNVRPYLSGDYVKINIRDEGVGIAEKHIEKIFDPYFTTKQTGSGLGLATVHSIVSKHKGHIAIESEVGMGTTFTLYLPADKTSLDLSDMAQTSITEKSNTMEGRVLVMDDDLAIRELLSSMLEATGYLVDSAVDGEEALEKYISASNSDNAFDIVIMDLTIPGGMGGKEAISKFIAIDSQVKAVVSSGYSTDPIMASYGDYGFSGRLAKPFKLADMLEEISRVMKVC